MTLIYEHDLDILNMYACTKTNFLSQDFQTLEHYRQTDRQMRLKTSPCSICR